MKAILFILFPVLMMAQTSLPQPFAQDGIYILPEICRFSPSVIKYYTDELAPPVYIQAVTSKEEVVFFTGDNKICLANLKAPGDEHSTKPKYHHKCFDIEFDEVLNDASIYKTEDKNHIFEIEYNGATIRKVTYYNSQVVVEFCIFEL